MKDATTIAASGTASALPAETGKDFGFAVRYRVTILADSGCTPVQTLSGTVTVGSGGTFTIASIWDGKTQTGGVAPDGQYDFFVEADFTRTHNPNSQDIVLDSLKTAAGSVFIDTVPPTLTVTSPGIPSPISRSVTLSAGYPEPLSLAGRAEDASGVVALTARANGTPLQVTGISPFSAPFSAVTGGDGPFWKNPVVVAATDAAGNVQTLPFDVLVPNRFTKGRIAVRFSSNADQPDIDAKLGQLGGQRIWTEPATHFYILSVPLQTDVLAAVQSLRADPLVDYALESVPGRLDGILDSPLPYAGEPLATPGQGQLAWYMSNVDPQNPQNGYTITRSEACTQSSDCGNSLLSCIGGLCGYIGTKNADIGWVRSLAPPNGTAASGQSLGELVADKLNAPRPLVAIVEGIGNFGQPDLAPSVYVNTLECCGSSTCNQLDANGAPICVEKDSIHEATGRQVPGAPGDDDHDGFADFDDPEIKTLLGTLCHNGVDDDGDGNTDTCAQGGTMPACCNGDDIVATWDDDENGLPDDAHGFDFGAVITDNKGQWAGRTVVPPGFTDASQHATATAGIIAAGINNGQGLTGIAPKAKILFVGLRTEDSHTFGPALRYARSRGADVVNMSFGYTYDSSAAAPDGGLTGQAWSDLQVSLRRAYDDATSPNIFYASSAGDEKRNLDRVSVDHIFRFPQNVGTATQFVTAGTTIDDRLASVFFNQNDSDVVGGSNYGATTVTLGAPGDAFSVLSADPVALTQLQASGTSLSAPIVSAAAAVGISAFPASFQAHPLLLGQQVIATRAPLASLSGAMLYPGRVDLASFLARPPPAPYLYTDVTPRLGQNVASNTSEFDPIDTNLDGHIDYLLEIKGGTYSQQEMPNLYKFDPGTRKFSLSTGQLPQTVAGNYLNADEGDLNGDGCLDIVLGGFMQAGPQPGQLVGAPNHLLLQTRQPGVAGPSGCTGSFTDVQNLGGKQDATYDVDIFDIDRDGDLDIWFTNARSAPCDPNVPLSCLKYAFFGPSNDQILLNNGDATFQDVTDRLLGSSIDVTNPFSSAACDINRDGRLDLVQGAAFLDRIYVQQTGLLVQHPDGTFVDEASSRGLQVAFKAGFAVACQDIMDASGNPGADGYPELIFANGTTGHPDLYLNDGTGHFRDISTKLPPLTNTESIEVCDLDSDGVGELVFGITGHNAVLRFDSSIGHYANLDGSGTSPDALGFDFATVSDATTNVKCLDLSGDGRSDSLIVGNHGQTSRLFTLSDEPCVTVSDGNPCTLDLCDPATGATVSRPVPDGTSCDDANWCTVADTCVSGTCQGLASSCDDHDPCTTDSCDSTNPVSSTRCSHAPVTTPTACDDHDPCTISDVCFGLPCAGTPVPVDDGNVCTADSCSGGTILHTPLTGASCSDTNACNGMELCDSSGTCQPGTPIATDDGNPCTSDLCDPATGAVTHPKMAAGTACTTPEGCPQGTCTVAGQCLEPIIDDNNPCTTDGCTVARGVFHDPLPQGHACSWLCAGTGVCSASSSNPDGSRVDPQCIRTVVPIADTDNSTIEICDDKTQQPRVITAGDRDLTGITTAGLVTKFIYTDSSGVTAPQQGVAAGTIEPLQASIVKGNVSARDGNPLQGVLVQVAGAPKYGFTSTQKDGTYSMTINGGEEATLLFSKPGFISGRRVVHSDSRDYRGSDDLVLVQADPVATPVTMTTDFATTTEAQIARGTAVPNGDGSMRQATVMIPAGTRAAGTAPDGSSIPISVLTVRLTEFTVGASGPAAMPAPLPPTSAYTYAVELSADEWPGGVTFDKQAFLYVENFLGFAPGTNVPTGFVEEKSGGWTASDNGRVIQVNSASDIQGAVGLGIDAEEASKLAELYTGKTIWRVPIQHFSSWDCNFGFAPPGDAVPPDPPDPDVPDNTENPDIGCGSIIEIQNRVVGETVPIVGTGLSLNYRSDRAAAYTANRSLNIPLRGATVPASLASIHLDVTVQGKTHSSDHDPSVLGTTFQWDGLDQFDKPVQGSVPVTVDISYVYPGQYSVPASFAGGPPPGGLITASTARQQLSFHKIWNSTLGGMNFDHLGFGSWSLSEQHFYDAGSVLYRGDGTRRTVNALGAVMERVVGSGTGSSVAFDPSKVIPGRSFTYGSNFAGVSFSPADSRVYFIHSSQTGPDLEDLLWLGSKGMVGSRAKITSGALTSDQTAGGAIIAAAPSGTLYVATNNSGSCYSFDPHCVDRVWTVAPDGTLQAFAGTGVTGDSGDGGQALNAQLRFPTALAVGPDGSVYVGLFSGKIRKVDSGGIITTVGGGGSLALSFTSDNADGQPAIDVSLGPIQSLAIDKEGNVYGVQANPGPVPITGLARLFMIDRTGLFRTPVSNVGWDLPPTIAPTLASDGLPLHPLSVAVGSGKVFVAGSMFDGSRERAWVGYLKPGRKTTRIAGSLDLPTYTPGPALGSSVPKPLMNGLTVASNGSLYVQGADSFNTFIWRIRPALPDLSGLREGDVTNLAVPSDDGSELYEFDYRGRHLRTVDGRTGVTLREFQYDDKNLLSAIVERVQKDASVPGTTRTTTIDRSTGMITITSPEKLKTTVILDTNGHVRTITNPNSEAYVISETATGLINSFQRPDGATSQYTFDSGGLLSTQTDPPTAGTSGVTHYDSVTATLPTVQRTSDLGRITNFSLQTPASGSEQRENAYPDGAQSSASKDPGGKQVVTARDGTVTETVLNADPGLGLPAQFDASLKTTLPSTLSQTTLSTRSTAFATPGDPFSLTQQVDTQCVNGQHAPDATLIDDATACTNGFKTVSTLNVDPTTRRSTRTTVTPFHRIFGETFDAQSRLTGTTPPETNATSITYDDQGRVSQIGQTGRMTTFGYDAASGFLTSITDPNNKTTTFTQLDGAGRPTQVTLPDTNVSSLGYDLDGRITSVTPPGKGTHGFGYNGLGSLSTYRPPLSAAVHTNYDTDRMLTSIAVDGLATDVASATYGTASGQLASLTLPSGSIGFGYDPTTGQLTSLTSPDTAGIVQLNQTFDGSFLKSLQWSGQAAGSVAWSRNSRFLTETETVLGGTAVPSPVAASACPTTAGCAQYRYDLDGIATTITSSTPTGPVAYQMALNDTTGRIETKTIGVIQETLAYNAYGELMRQTVANTTTPTAPALFDAVYDSTDALPTAAGKRDALGRILKKTELVDGTTRTYEYGYNPNGRSWLEGIKIDGALVSSYAYDGNGNRTAVDVDHGYAGGTHVTLSATTSSSDASALPDIVTDAEDRLRQYGKLSFEFDAQGRVFQKTDASVNPPAITTYTWDSLGALKSVTLPDNKVIEYQTDALGRRVGRKVNGVLERRWIYRDTLRPVAELDPSGNVVARYIYRAGTSGKDEALATLQRRFGAAASAGSTVAAGKGSLTPEYVVRADGVYRLITDQLGSVKIVVNVSSGAVVLKREYDEYGIVLSETGSMAGTQVVPFGFAGGLYDPDTNLIRFGAREYNAETGTWVARDPIRFGGGQANLYAYVRCDPINRADPSGLDDDELNLACPLLFFLGVLGGDEAGAAYVAIRMGATALSCASCQGEENPEARQLCWASCGTSIVGKPIPFCGIPESGPVPKPPPAPEPCTIFNNWCQCVGADSE